jgi:hypothetical protein
MCVVPRPSVPPGLTKPTPDTKFHIDYDWWEREGRNLRIYLHGHLCPEHQEVFATHIDTQEVDWVDPETAEVTRVDGLRHTLRVHCSQQPGYITEHTSLVDAIFRVFLANNNRPLSSLELAERIRRPAETILLTLSGRQIYKGLRPAPQAE